MVLAERGQVQDSEELEPRNPGRDEPAERHSLKQPRAAGELPGDMLLILPVSYPCRMCGQEAQVVLKYLGLL